MRFELTEEQRDLARTLDDLFTRSDAVAASRAWEDDDPGPGLAIMRQVAEVGLMAFCVPEELDGVGAQPIDLVTAFESIGRHLAPGPYIETAVLVPTLLSAVDVPDTTVLERLSSGETIASAAAPPLAPYALDADVADLLYLLHDETLYTAAATRRRRSVDGGRHLFEVEPGGATATATPAIVAKALDLATLACTAQLLGLGERILSETVAYALLREQFGRPIGQFQAIKHALANVRVALDFARPLLYKAALALGTDDESSERDVSAAKVATGDAAYLAARTGLQVHGAIGYTRELSLGLAIAKVRALRDAWGTPAFHRSRVLESLMTDLARGKETW
jgi:alkylation response protein AidB-like acyl-CoA dehydrogenase